jgi:hypothetical protein
VALFPAIRPWFIEYALHMKIAMGENVITTTTLLSGLIIWNAVMLAAVWLFACLHNAIKH